MKKLLLLMFVASIGIAGTATAQQKSKKDWNDKNKYSKKYDRYDRNDRDDRYDRNDRDDRYDRNNDNDKYSNNAPRKVRDAFNRDYPNVSSVSWTKDRGVWTANFKRKGLFGGNNSVSYRANGERVRDTDYNRTARSNNTPKKSPIWN